MLHCIALCVVKLTPRSGKAASLEAPPEAPLLSADVLAVAIIGAVEWFGYLVGMRHFRCHLQFNPVHAMAMHAH
jgi:hypothetical protein